MNPQQQSSQAPAWLIFLAVLAFVAYSTGIVKFAPTTPTPAVPAAPAVAVPSAIATELAAIAGIAKANPAAAKEAAKAWRDFAAVLRSSSLKTTGDLRTAITTFEPLLWQGTPMVGALPGVSAQVNAVLAKQLGLEDGPLDREKAAQAFEFIAQALGG